MYTYWPITIFLIIFATFTWWLTYRNAKDHGVVYDTTRYMDSFSKKKDPKSFKHWYNWRLIRSIVIVIIAFGILYF